MVMDCEGQGQRETIFADKKNFSFFAALNLATVDSVNSALP